MLKAESMRRFVIVLGICSCLSLRAQPSGSLNDDAAEEQPGPAHARREPGELETTQNYNAEAIGIRTFDEKKWREAVDGADFSETPALEPENKPAPDYSLPWAGAVLKIVSYIAVAAIVIFLLYLVLREISFDVKTKRTPATMGDPEKPPENIEDIDISGEFDRARREGNFRLAVRLYYLALLRKLHEMEIISWKKDKTNRDYLSEIFLKDFHFPEIRGLTFSYEAIWYGGRHVNEMSFQDLSSRFEAAFQKIDNRERQ